MMDIDCPECHGPGTHTAECPMRGMSMNRSSLLYGWPVCMCCGLWPSPERVRIHEQKMPFTRSWLPSEQEHVS